MTADDFRRMALSLPETSEGAHMGHPDFRIGGKIFATLGYPNNRYAVVRLTSYDQDLIAKDHPKAFAPVPGSWGSGGATTILLRAANQKIVRVALEAAWRKSAPKRLRS
jgi:hypothetical protein